MTGLKSLLVLFVHLGLHDYKNNQLGVMGNMMHHQTFGEKSNKDFREW
jgi:hypothetical protein